MRRGGWLGRSLTALAAVVVMQVSAPGCSVGEGTGTVGGTLDVPNCWSGNFDLSPNFFAAVPFDNAITIRIQNGDDYTAFSDGVSILVDNVHEVRGDAPYSPSLLNLPLKVDNPAGVTVAGAPVVPVVDPALVHMTLYLQHSCPAQNVVLSVLESVSVGADGSCTPPPPQGPYILTCQSPTAAGLSALAYDAGISPTDSGALDASASGTTVLPANPPVRHSTMTFSSLFDANPYESNAAEALTQATFDVYLADPRDGCPGGGGPPPPCRGHLTGNFKFYFERGRPGQPFP